jgi:hypothetical protein
MEISELQSAMCFVEWCLDMTIITHHIYTSLGTPTNSCQPLRWFDLAEPTDLEKKGKIIDFLSN